MNLTGEYNYGKTVTVTFESKLEQLARQAKEAKKELEAAERKHAAAKRKLLDYVEEKL